MERARLHPPVEHENVILGTHLARITDADLRSAFLERMTEQSAADDPAFRQDYWRLNLRARRPESSPGRISQS